MLNGLIVSALPDRNAEMKIAKLQLWSRHAACVFVPAVADRVEREGQRLKGVDHVLARAQTPPHHPAAQRSVTNKSLQVQESSDSVLRSLSHE